MRLVEVEEHPVSTMLPRRIISRAFITSGIVAGLEEVTRENGYLRVTKKGFLCENLL